MFSEEKLREIQERARRKRVDETLAELEQIQLQINELELRDLERQVANKAAADRLTRGREMAKVAMLKGQITRLTLGQHIKCCPNCSRGGLTETTSTVISEPEWASLLCNGCYRTAVSAKSLPPLLAGMVCTRCRKGLKSTVGYRGVVVVPLCRDCIGV